MLQADWESAGVCLTSVVRGMGGITVSIVTMCCLKKGKKETVICMVSAATGNAI